MARRAYDRTLRDAQARQTRVRVLDAVIAALARQEEISVPALAEKAGVSVPTVYRLFPSREALMPCVDTHAVRLSPSHSHTAPWDSRHTWVITCVE